MICEVREKGGCVEVWFTVVECVECVGMGGGERLVM